MITRASIAAEIEQGEAGQTLLAGRRHRCQSAGADARLRLQLEHLLAKMQRPRCHSNLMTFEWIISDPASPPYTPAVDIVLLRFRPTRAP